MGLLYLSRESYKYLYLNGFGGNDQISTYMLQEGIAYYNAVLDELEAAGVMNKARIMMFNDRQL